MLHIKVRLKEYEKINTCINCIWLNSVCGLLLLGNLLTKERNGKQWENITIGKSGILAPTIEKNNPVGIVKTALAVVLGQEILNLLMVGKLKKHIINTWKKQYQVIKL